MVVTDSGAGGQEHTAVQSINGGNRVVQQLDALGGVKFGRAKQQIAFLNLAEQIPLGQGGALIG
ncbi:hypothetical protein D3C80_1794340 [compost metagenome]